jgi:hypothetical protein
MEDINKIVNDFKKQMNNQQVSAQKAVAWYKKKIENLAGITGNQIMASDQSRLIRVSNVDESQTGRMLMYFYDPKHKETLPYYDMFPLTIPFSFHNDGFTGMNLHYLPLTLRARLLDGLYTHYKSKHLDENRKLQLSWKMLNSSTKIKHFQPCIHRYLTSHIRSSVYQVDPEEWELMLSLPTERFMKQQKEEVWRQAKKGLGLR